jgi:hypothetical protein
MVVIQSRSVPRAAAADDRPPALSGGCSRSRRVRRSRRVWHRLWALLNAQALLSGTAVVPGGVLPIEDDRRRLAARRER